MRDEVVGHVTEVELVLAKLPQWRGQKSVDQIAQGEHDIQLRTELIRGLLPEFKREANWIAPEKGK
jgi:hypothetical protein